MSKSYYEVIVEGSCDLIKGFVLGFMEGKGIRGESVFEEAERIKVEGTLEQIIRMSGIKGKRIHIIIESGFYKLLNEALMKVKDRMDLKVISAKEIIDARFDFHYKAFTNELGDELKGLFSNLKGGLKIRGDYSPEESVMPEGKGIEAYAPLHAYKLSAKGEIHGPAMEVFGFYRKLELYDMVELGDIELKYAD
ncbi:MAG: hypothetical protein JXB42_03560 [Deltaproteobacteria bacterium]|nr:hypothetical protein [Deltaproteobacteria bacterium]